MDPSDAQQMHGYTYSNNNPVTLSDPTGLFLDGLRRAVRDAIVGGANWVGNTVADGAKSAWSGIKKGVMVGLPTAANVQARFSAVVDGVKFIAKHGAPILGAAALIGSMFTPVGWVAALGTVSFGLGIVNVASNCGFGQGSGADCAMDVAGAVPGLGKYYIGAFRSLTRGLGTMAVSAIGMEGRAAQMLANTERKIGLSPNGWLNKPVAGAGYEKFANGMFYLGAAWYVGCDLKVVSACGDLPKMPPLMQARVQPRYVDQPVPLAPILMYPPGYTGPKVSNSKTASSWFEWHSGNSGPGPTPGRGAPPKKSVPGPNNTYQTGDGRTCNRGGGMCAV
jgi:hypothetical protein